MLADSLFRPPITPFCSLLPSYHLLFSHLTPLTLFSHLTPLTLFSHLTTSLFSHLTTSLLSHLTTSYSPILPLLLSSPILPLLLSSPILPPPYSPILPPPYSPILPPPYSPILPPPTTNLSPLSYHSPTYSPCFHHSHLFHPFHLTFSSFSSLLQCSFFSNLQIFHS